MELAHEPEPSLSSQRGRLPTEPEPADAQPGRQPEPEPAHEPEPEPEQLVLAEALALIASDLGLDHGLDADELLRRAADDLGIALVGAELRARAQHCCHELGIETGWGWAPAAANSVAAGSAAGAAAAAASSLDESVQEPTDAEKLEAIFAKFDLDADGRLGADEASAYSLAKQGEGLDEAAWEDVCEALKGLQTQNLPFPDDEAFQVIAEDYGAPGPLAPGHPFAHGDPNAKPLFAEFGHTSVAAASLGQVYKARTWDGRDIVCSRVCEGDFASMA